MSFGKPATAAGTFEVPAAVLLLRVEQVLGMAGLEAGQGVFLLRPLPGSRMMNNGDEFVAKGGDIRGGRGPQGVSR